MIGMGFASFLVLLIVGFIAAVILYSSVSYPASRRADGFFAAWIAGWIGGWLGSPVLGHWWLRIQNVYIIPALVGAFVLTFMLMYWRNATATVGAAPKVITAVASQPEMQRKAS